MQHERADFFIRGDYKELVELVVQYIEPESFEDIFKKKFVFRKPGAHHKARWMARLLYGLKMLLLRKLITKELHRGTVFAYGQIKNWKGS